jgi:NitT/TauT family transport system permease protein
MTAIVASTANFDASRRSSGHTVRKAWSVVWPPLAFGVAFVLLWEAVVQGFDLKPYFLPAPSAVLDAFVDNFDNVWKAVKVSGANALVGLIAGAVLGVALSFALMRFDILNLLVSPLAVALNAIPIVVMVALFTTMYSSTSEIPRRLMVTIIVNFIVLVNVSKGLRQVHRTHLELLRSLAASPGAVLRKARIPNAIPYFFTSLKIAAPTAVITAFVSEYFGGRQNGLGYFIPSNFANAKTAEAWAFVIGACLLGLAFYLVSILMEYITQHNRGPAPGGA